MANIYVTSLTPINYIYNKKLFEIHFCELKFTMVQIFKLKVALKEIQNLVDRKLGLDLIIHLIHILMIKWS